MYSVESSAGMRAASGRRRPAWDRWPDTFWLGRWSLSLQPPPLPLSPSRPSHKCVRVGPPATGPNAAGRPRRGGPPAVVSESYPSGESGDADRGRRGAGAGLRGRSELASPTETKASHLGADVGTHAVRDKRESGRCSGAVCILCSVCAGDVEGATAGEMSALLRDA